MASGIYLIRVERPGAMPLAYIGQSVDLWRRARKHTADLRAGRHHNVRLQRAFQKYGDGAVSFSILEECSPEKLDASEQAWIDRYWGNGLFVNIARYADSSARGRKMSAAVRRKMSAAHRGKVLTEEHRRRISAGNSGDKNGQWGKRDSAESRAARAMSMMAEKNPRFGMVGSALRSSKAVEGTHLITGKKLRFESINLAKGAGFDSSAVSRACHGKLRHHKGYAWEFACAAGVKP